MEGTVLRDEGRQRKHKGKGFGALLTLVRAIGRSIEAVCSRVGLFLLNISTVL